MGRDPQSELTCGVQGFVEMDGREIRNFDLQGVSMSGPTRYQQTRRASLNVPHCSGCGHELCRGDQECPACGRAIIGRRHQGITRQDGRNQSQA